MTCSLAQPSLLGVAFTWTWTFFRKTVFVSGAVVSQPPEDSKEVWGYVTVRKDAHVFWWLYYATSSHKNFSELPLIMWLQVKVLLPDLRLRPGFPHLPSCLPLKAHSSAEKN